MTMPLRKAIREYRRKPLPLVHVMDCWTLSLRSPPEEAFDAEDVAGTLQHDVDAERAWAFQSEGRARNGGSLAHHQPVVARGA